MNYLWDPQKAARNRRDHKIDFADAVMVFEDELALTIVADDPAECLLNRPCDV